MEACPLPTLANAPTLEAGGKKMTVSIKKVAIMSPGDMGGAMGKVLHSNGLEVYTCLAGRSALTRTRAEEGGFRDLPDLDSLVAEVDLFLSVLVPSEPLPLARAVAASMRRTDHRPVYVDCNAIAPETVHEIDALIRAEGATFIDAGIIGSPPRQDGGGRFHCSGPDTSAFEVLRNYGLDVRVVGPEIGQASGLKMVYAASTKGTTALWTELMTAAQAMGLRDALIAELGGNVRQANSITGMPRRARRWVPEMEEIAATFSGLGLTPHIFEGAADMYRLVGETALADQTSREPDPSLDQVLESLVERLNE
jgi:3-hydroxyisobutyrate dehydrogenase-like beta-hydroxyacid dehydrogenase